MKLTARLVHGVALCAALIGLTSFGATEAALWQGDDLAEGVTKNGMTLRLNGNTASGGVITVGSYPVYVETGMTSSSAHGGTEATVVVTWANIGESYSGLVTFTTPQRQDTVGIESYYGSLYGILEGSWYYGDWQSFVKYPTGADSHKVAFACAGPTSGLGSGGYTGGAFVIDGGTVYSRDTLYKAGYTITRINIGGYEGGTTVSGAKITSIKVFPRALTEAELKKATGEDEPEPEEGDVWGNVGNATDGGIATKADNGNYGSTWTVNFANTTNICSTGIGSNGVVRIKQIKIARRNNDGNTPPASLQLEQGTVSSVSTNMAIVTGGISAYTTGKSVLSGSTRDAYVFTFDAAVEFDTTKPITLTFDVTTVGLGVMQPANPLFQSGNHSPMIEITGEYVADQALDPMYKNRLSTGEASVPAGKYGAITVPETGFSATAFLARTQLSTETSGEEIVGSYANIIKKPGDTDTATHTFMGWFKVASDTQDVYYALNSQTDGDNGYKVAVSSGKIQVGKTKQFGWNTVGKDDAPGGCVTSQEAVIEAGKWYHIAVSLTKTADKRSITPVVFVNGVEIAMEQYGGATKKFPSNLNNGVCNYVGIAANVSASGIYVDTAALTTPTTIIEAALAAPKPYSPIPPILPDANFSYVPKALASPSGWMTSFDGASFSTDGQFRVAPDGECVSVVSSDQNPWKNLGGKSNYTMALYADISQVAHDMTGRYMLTVGSKNSNINHGILMTQNGNVQLYQAKGSTIQCSATTTAAPESGYHLFVWTQSTANGGKLYIDGEEAVSLPGMTNVTTKGFQIGNMHGGVWNNTYSQGVGMAVAGVYGWDQVLSDAQIGLLSVLYPFTPGAIEVKTVDSNITGTLNLVDGSTIASGEYNCAIALSQGATVNVTYPGEIEEGAVLLAAKSISAEGATFTVNGQALPPGLAFDVASGRLVIGKPKATELLNPYAVMEGGAIKVSCNAAAPQAEAAKAYDSDTSTYFAPGDAANNLGVSWTGIEFTNGVIVSRIAFVGRSGEYHRMVGGVFQGANSNDFSDAVKIYAVEDYTGGTEDIVLEEAKGPFKYLRFIGTFGGNVADIKFYGLPDSGTLAPSKAPVITGESVDGVAHVYLTADAEIPQLYVVQRAMASFCEDGDYETFVTLAPQLGASVHWTDTQATGYSKYRARGFNANGESAWTYFEMTPEKLIKGAAAPSFSGNLPGFYESAASVEITYPVQGAKIYYTTDGSMPTTNSTEYTGAIPLADVCSEANPLSLIPTSPPEMVSKQGKAYAWYTPSGDQPNINIIRARAFMPDGSASTNDIAGAWMIGPTANSHTLRVVSIQTDDAEYFGDPRGIMVPGDIYNEKGFGSHSVGRPNANYFQKGIAWERPVQIEMFEANHGKEIFSATMGTRVHGNYSRAAAKKTLVCYARKEYGQKNIKKALFNDEPDHKKFKRFTLRNGGNDWYQVCLRDAVGQSVFRGEGIDLNTDTQGYEPTVLYINGEYWGIYNLRHAYSRQHFEEWNGAAEDDIDYVKVGDSATCRFELQEGDFCALWNLLRYMVSNTSTGVMDDTVYAQVESQVDIADMIDYHIVHFFLGNNDWLGNYNNMGMWRSRSGDDLKWHFTVYDCDSIQNLVNSNDQTRDHISQAITVTDTGDTNDRMMPGFFKRCFMNEGFKKRFANRYADLLNTALKAERTTNILAQAAAKIEPEIDRTVARWTNMESHDKWTSRFAKINTFYKERPAYAFQHLKNHCSSGAFASITLANTVGKGAVKLNTITSGEHFELPFTGQYFTDIPVTLTAVPESGYEFAGWKIGEEVVSEEETMTLTPTNGVTIQAVFEEAGESEQKKYFRLWGICGAPDGGSSDANEFIIFTNLNPNAELDISGAEFQTEKSGAAAEGRCHFFMPEGTKIAAGGWIRFNQADVPWTKITDNKIDIWLKDSEGTFIYQLYLEQEALGVRETGYFAVYDNAAGTWSTMLIKDAPGQPEPPKPAEELLLTGSYPDGTNITLKADTTIIVSNATFGAKLAFSTNFVATIVLPEDTVSTIPQITAEGKLVFDGEGKLTIAGKKELISTTGDWVVDGGDITITATPSKDKDAAVLMKGNYLQSGGKVTLNLCGEKRAYGLQWKDQKGFTATIAGGEFVANIASGASSAAFKSNKGSNDFIVSGGKLTATLASTDASVADVAGNVKINGTAVVDVTGDETATHARVFKTEKKVTIGGTATVDVKVPGVESEAFSADNQITVEGGIVRVEACDDCFSAQTNIVVSGGIVYGHSISNDVFDSNGEMTISGGTVIAYTLAEGHEAFDTEPAAADEQSHTFTISGGTIVGLGGKNAAWPSDCNFEQNTFTGTKLDPATYSGKHLVVDGVVETLYAKLPKIDDTFILLATVKELAGDPTVSDTCPIEEPIAEGVPAWRKLKHNQQNLRFAEIYGNTLDGLEGDTGEYFVLTNVSENAVYLNNLEIEITKSADKKSKSKCNFKATGDLRVEPYGTYTFEQDDWKSAGWTKITNGDLRLVLTDADGKEVQKGETSNDFYPECDGNGASLVAKTFGKKLAMTTDDWEPSFRWYYFTTDGVTSTITGFGTTKLLETTLTIPRELGKVPVTLVAEGAFANCALTTLKVTLTNETLKVMKTEGAAIAQYDMSESEGELVLGYALGSALKVSTTAVLGSSAATLAFDLGEGVTQEINGTTDDVARLYGITVYSGTLNFTKSAGATSFRDRVVTADGTNAVLRLGVRDATGYENPAVRIVVKNGGTMQVIKRDTLIAPVELNDGTVRLMAGCADNSRGFDLYNASGNNWTVSGDSTFAVDPAIGTGDGRKLVIRQGDWNVDVAEDSLFTVEPTIVAQSSATTVGKIVKTGAGTLYLAATNNTYETETVVNGGTLKLAQGELNGALTMAADTALDLHYDGTPTHGTVVLTAATLNLADSVAITVDGVSYVIAKSETTLTIMDPVAQVGDKSFGTIVAAAKAAGDGGVMKLLKPYAELEDEIEAAAITLTPGEGENVYTNNYIWSEGIVLRVSEIMPKPSDKPYEITTQSGYDKNGLESGWVELLNTTNAWVDLKDYKFMRANRGKKANQADYGNFPSVMIGPNEYFLFYTSERYANSASKADSAFEHGTFDGKPIWYGDMLIWGDKVNPKKFPMVTFAYRPAGAKKETVVDTVVIPSDIPEGYSIIVGERDSASYTKRWLCDTPTFNAPNDEALQPLGPNVGPLYGKKHSVSEFNPMPPAQFGEDYEITLNANPVYNGTDSDEITNVVLVYRTKLDDDTLGEVTMTFVTNDTAGAGMTYTATIPHEAFDSIGNGQVIQWKTRLYDAAGNVWTSPSFNNPDDGYEWYGTITEPGDLNSANLPTWHMFLDADSLEQMDVDADEQTLPNKARAAIYDASTSNYYDYVRIDLRGNTSKKFTKKSHGFRFAKAHPLTMRDIVSGEDIEEIRKTSLIGEPADPSYMRQLISFWLLNRVGSPAPFDFPVRCNRNGEFYQMAFNSERFTDELIEDVYGLDKYGYSYKNVGTLKSGGGTTAGSIEKKTPDDGHEDDISVLQNELRAKIKAAQQVGGTTAEQLIGTDTTGLNNAALTKFVVQKFNLPAWLNYLAVTRITQEMDDVWANISVYYDNPEMKEGVRGTGTWMPLAYDMNLSFGQHYVEGGVGRTGPIGNLDRFKGHPFYGGNRVRCYSNDECTSAFNNGNDGFESVWQNAKFRRLYLRRLRTLMDQELKAPGTPETEIPLMVQMRELEAIMHDDAAIDRKKYPDDGSFSAIDVWGSKNFPTNMTAGIDDLWTNYIQPRQTHLFVTHSVTNVSDTWQIGYGVKCNAGIPGPQSPIAELKGGFSAEFDEVNGVVIIRNANDEAVDLSNWSLEGPLLMTLPPGTVVDSNDCVHVAADRRAYVAAIDADITDQVIVGNGSLGKDPTAAIVLKDADGTPVIDPESKSEQEKYLRLWGFCGAPDKFDEGKGEFFILTNINQSAALDVGGLDLNFCGADKPDVDSKCHIVLNAGLQIAAGGWMRICLTDTDKFTGTWTKIANHQLRITICDNKGVKFIYFECVDQDALGVYCNGYALRYDFAKGEWIKTLISEMPGSEPEPPPGPSGDVISGEFPEGTNIVLTADKTLIVSNANFGAALTLSGAYATTLYLPSDTTSRIPVLTAKKGAITVDGAGTLVMSNDVQMVTCAGLIVTNGTLDITYTGNVAESKAIELTGSYVQYGGTLNLALHSSAEVYGIWMDTKKIDVQILGGTFNATIDGGDKSAAFKLCKGSNNVTLGGGTVNVNLAGTGPRFVQTKAKTYLKGSTVTIAGEAPNARVFKSVETLSISDGVVKGEATGEGSEIFSADDDIKVEGGVVSVTAGDDCFSAQTNIVISAGKVQALSTGGDAIDSNGDVTIDGGYVFATTCYAGGYGIEADGAFTISGGNVVAVGAPNFIHAPDEGSIACYTNANIASLKKYLELTSDYIDHTEKLSVNLEKGKKRCTDGFSLVAVVPNMYGTYTDNDTKPSKQEPAGVKLDENIDGVFVTTIEKTTPSIVPGSTSTSYETEDEAAAVAAETTVSRPAEVAQSGAITEEAYADLFDVTVVQTATSTWELMPELKPTVSNEVQAAANAAVISTELMETMTTAEPTAKVKTQAGLFYGLAVSEALDDVGTVDLPFAKWVLGTGGEQQLKADKPGESSGFYQIRVQIAPPKP